ncbi:Imm53 family immunity protein [Sphaerisporangium sp. NPDC005289]|uniref:Imm53 family immunity protein n=1 Tax=Sphaerisporangium sp. NPDC005289 TaxID=3155247 RepID=UPI0033BC1B50
MVADAFAFLQSWYASCCNDDWEHSYGVTIDTLDNPGWHLKIDLVDTPLAGTTLDHLAVERTEDHTARHAGPQQATAYSRSWSRGSARL